MQHDEMIWQVINNQFCSFKTTIGSAKSDKRDFCRHPYSVTGLCNRSSCPLANSRYATVREENGRVSLYLKTVERAHSPKNLWERISLSRNYAKALAQLDEHLAFWPKNLVHRNKQRLTKIHQYLIRMRKIKLKQLAGQKAKMVGINRKLDQREERREKKALVAAKIENNIEKELLERLANGTYGDIYNFPEDTYQKALEEAGTVQEEEGKESVLAEREEEMEQEGSLVEYVEDLDEEGDDDEDEYLEYDNNEQSESEEETAGGPNHTDDMGSSSEDDDEGSSDESEGGSEDKRRSKGSGKKKTRPKKRSGAEMKTSTSTEVEIEYEEENEDEEAHLEGVAGMAW